ncbi:MAG TPA: radical SAM family heme chaperone HemW [Marinagarivorans sp.]
MPQPITDSIPLSLYVHIPWCVRKCPYCDFNSHTTTEAIPEQAYTERLIADLRGDLQHYSPLRPLTSIFFGGGTPSLFSANAIGQIIDAARAEIGFTADIEITLEANPGTAEYTDFGELRRAGVNRLSIGVQTFNDQHLTNLGRIHNAQDASDAFHKARLGGFGNINLDLMHGLAKQTPAQALSDLQTAVGLGPEHLSWYQLTIEPNTVFYTSPPTLPNEDTLSDIQDKGEALLAQMGYRQYEVSAFARAGKAAQHNLNYWQYGDYLGIGAGAHGKLTYPDGHIERYRKTRLPSDYLNPAKKMTAGRSRVTPERRPLEFMMNALRLPQGVPTALFEQRTQIPIESILATLEQLQREELLEFNDTLKASPLGFRHLNSLLNRFDTALNR